MSEQKEESVPGQNTVSEIYESAAERAAMEAEFERQSEEARFRMAHGYDQSGESVNAKDEEGKEMAGEAFEETHNHKEPLAH
uniref:Uncharacterized protein n=1 Tax=Meloidogyne incognita TaxID=6306 RepID=A0A914KSE5_MELIC